MTLDNGDSVVIFTNYGDLVVKLNGVGEFVVTATSSNVYIDNHDRANLLTHQSEFATQYSHIKGESNNV
jgi:formylmethanofuran dehydrogenase subunit D